MIIEPCKKIFKIVTETLKELFFTFIDNFLRRSVIILNIFNGGTLQVMSNLNMTGRH